MVSTGIIERVVDAATEVDSDLARSGHRPGSSEVALLQRWESDVGEMDSSNLLLAIERRRLALRECDSPEMRRMCEKGGPTKSAGVRLLRTVADGMLQIAESEMASRPR